MHLYSTYKIILKILESKFLATVGTWSSWCHINGIVLVLPKVSCHRKSETRYTFLTSALDLSEADLEAHYTHISHHYLLQ